MHIALIISSLSCGGAERVMSLMANFWAERGTNITLITLDSGEDFYPTRPEVKRISLNVIKISETIIGSLNNNFIRLKVIRRQLKELKPDVVISFMDRTNILVLIATAGLGIPVIISERTDPSQRNIGAVWHLLRKLTYRHANAIVVQTESVCEWVRNNIGIRCFVQTIPNPINSSFYMLPQCNQVRKLHENRYICAMGRLIESKGFKYLIMAFKKLSCKFLDWNLTIMGEGEKREELQSLIAELALSDRVVLMGKVKRPASILFSSDIFVLSSIYEGFPNALLEAMACGLPSVSFDCPSGPNTIIRNGYDGILVPKADIDSLASALEKLINSEELRRSIGTRALEVRQRYSIEKVMDMWDSVITTVRIK
ncbi:GalNAc-alpha-(1-_4)-GalNAc-alpha-(1-_3)-diNAcBac-PP-undecaprenol alpha-1,4-N-acetyl-D-galactosaminyltransferase [Sporomusa rhizae]|uniref:glycosyltransferase family 4 protein n=1 Tax=Sporomusa rhizae TaxID=357999 RepID=UPI00352A2D67